MKWLGTLLRWLAKARFRILGLATIKDIPTERFKTIVLELKADGWRPTWQYKGIDAWIDYGSIKMRKGFRHLKFEWDNWTEGSVEGTKPIIQDLAKRYQLPVSYVWRWSEYDNNV